MDGEAVKSTLYTSTKERKGTKRRKSSRDSRTDYQTTGKRRQSLKDEVLAIDHHQVSSDVLASSGSTSILDGVQSNDGHQTSLAVSDSRPDEVLAIDHHQVSSDVLASIGSTSIPDDVQANDQTSPAVSDFTSSPDSISIPDEVLAINHHQVSSDVLASSGSTSIPDDVQANDGHQPSPAVSDYTSSPDKVLAINLRQVSSDVLACRGSTSIPDGVQANDGHQTSPAMSDSTSSPVTWALYDVCILSNDNNWRDELLEKLKDWRPDLKCTSEKDWVGGKLTRDIIPTHRSEVVVIGLRASSDTAFINYVATNVLERILKSKTFEDRRLILVKLSKNVKMPMAFEPFTKLNAWDENYIPILLEAIDNRAKGTLCQVKVKKLISKVVEGVKEGVHKEFTEKLSIDINEYVPVDSNENEFDYYIVSGNNEWEEKASAELKKRNENLKVICRKNLISDISTGDNLKKTTDGSVLNTLLKPVQTTKKVIVGFEARKNGYVNSIAENVVDRQCKKGGDDKMLIVVKISADAVIPHFVEHVCSEIANDDFYNAVLKTLEEKCVTVNVSCKNTSSANYEEIERVLNEKVKELQRHPNVYVEITNYFSDIGLKFKGITTGCLVLHLSAHDPGALRRLSDFNVRKDIMKALAEFLLPGHLQEEFRKEWLMDIDKEKYEATLMELETDLGLKNPQEDILKEMSDNISDEHQNIETDNMATD